jgi:hypothetical protein
MYYIFKKKYGEYEKEVKLYLAEAQVCLAIYYFCCCHDYLSLIIIQYFSNYIEETSGQRKCRCKRTGRNDGKCYVANRNHSKVTAVSVSSTKNPASKGVLVAGGQVCLDIYYFFLLP